MRIEVQLFATLRDRAGAKTVSLDLPDESATVGQLLDRLAATYPALALALPSTIVAVNQEFAFRPTLLHTGDEIALFPPVSGGAGFPELFRITDGSIDLNEIVAQVTRPTTGAVCTFTGTVRGQSEQRETARLDYEAYTPMAEAKLRQVAQEIRERWPQIEGISIVQRVGRLTVGEFTVLIAVSAGHRYDGVFEAARYGIDRLKEIVPVWKKEIGPRGEEWVEGQYQPTPADAHGAPIYEP
ncbi:MAG TPA: molybdopterin converting factor subunit 1 [Anaerolineae bacterium]|nr:molybdopterin converting factor subunit 1 [Anaerolineae bacterium]